MKKILILFLVAGLISFLIIPSMTYADGVPKVSVNPTKKAYNPGESGILLIKFKPGPKVKIPSEPQIEVTITSGNISGDGFQNYPSSEYIPNSLVKYKFSVPSDAEQNTIITISGTIKFGYCSMESGICKIGERSFTTSIKVK